MEACRLFFSPIFLALATIFSSEQTDLSFFGKEPPRNHFLWSLNPSGPKV